MSGVKRYDCTNGGANFCQGCYTMTECELGDYVSSEDYDTLRTTNQRLEGEVKALREALTPQVVDWVRCGMATNGRLVDGSHPALEKLLAALAGDGGVE